MTYSSKLFGSLDIRLSKKLLKRFRRKANPKPLIIQTFTQWLDSLIGKARKLSLSNYYPVRVAAQGLSHLGCRVVGSSPALATKNIRVEGVGLSFISKTFIALLSVFLKIL